MIATPRIFEDVPMINPTTDYGQALALLRHALNNPRIDFRDGQWEAIDTLVNGRARLLIVERTGWEKVPSILLRRASCATGVRDRR